ncbi:hypothetical protein [Falsiroseomonas sp. CW058]|uniref:hypothetical protein n=1 Tax=Falsiroseomonas sp. CW058 TaxID=3388664 RepID=UPI003D31555F
MPPHDLVFSLGPNCRNAWNTRSHFGVTRAYPFDWWITPAKAMLQMLDPGFAFHVLPGDLVVTPTVGDGENSVYNRRLNLLHHHDFPRRDRQVQEIRPDDIAALNDKYAALFARFRQDVADARAPLALVNGIARGWPQEPGGTGRPDRHLNGAIAPQELVDGIRSRLGSKVTVAIVTVGPEQVIRLDGGVQVSRPDLGRREPRGTVPGYAEPVHAFRACYQTLGLEPAGPG